MTDKRLENDIETDFCDYVGGLGYRARKLSEPGRRGWPDRTIFTHGGRVICFEFKRPGGGKLSPDQIRTIMRLEDLGVPVYVVDDLATAKSLFDKHLSTRG